jgi:hypothetical protein
MNEGVKCCGACRKVLLNERRDYCDRRCKRDAAYARERLLRGTKTPRKRRLATTPLNRVRNGPKNSIGTVACKRPSTPDLGASVRAQIVAQQDEPNPIGFALPDGSKGRVWLASNKRGIKVIGDDWLWRANIEELNRQGKRRPKITLWLPTAKALRRPIIVVGRNDPIPNLDVALGELKGFKVRLCIEDEKELQVLGCGWRIVTCQFRCKTVLLHHNGNTATMKRPAFKALIAANKRLRRKRPALRLVVSNPRPSIPSVEAA